MAHRQRLLTQLAEYRDRHPDERMVAARFERFVAQYPRCFERDCWPGHVTGSVWLLNPAGTHVLLTHHRKLGRWLQLGGHSDGEADTLAAARREAEEESGLSVLIADTRIFDLDVHEIPARGHEPAHLHYDVRFLGRAVGEDFRISRESIELAWVPLPRVHAYNREPSVVRMAEKWQTVRYQK